MYLIIGYMDPLGKVLSIDSRVSEPALTCHGLQSPRTVNARASNGRVAQLILASPATDELVLAEHTLRVQGLKY